MLISRYLEPSFLKVRNPGRPWHAGGPIGRGDYYTQHRVVILFSSKRTESNPLYDLAPLSAYVLSCWVADSGALEFFAHYLADGHFILVMQFHFVTCSGV